MNSMLLGRRQGGSDHVAEGDHQLATVRDRRQALAPNPDRRGLDQGLQEPRPYRPATAPAPHPDEGHPRVRSRRSSWRARCLIDRNCARRAAADVDADLINHRPVGARQIPGRSVSWSPTQAHRSPIREHLRLLNWSRRRIERLLDLRLAQVNPSAGYAGVVAESYLSDLDRVHHETGGLPLHERHFVIAVLRSDHSGRFLPHFGSCADERRLDPTGSNRRRLG